MTNQFRVMGERGAVMGKKRTERRAQERELAQRGSKDTGCISMTGVQDECVPEVLPEEVMAEKVQREASARAFAEAKLEVQACEKVNMERLMIALVQGIWNFPRHVPKKLQASDRGLRAFRRAWRALLNRAGRANLRLGFSGRVNVESIQGAMSTETYGPSSTGSLMPEALIMSDLRPIIFWAAQLFDRAVWRERGDDRRVISPRLTQCIERTWKVRETTVGVSREISVPDWWSDPRRILLERFMRWKVCTCSYVTSDIRTNMNGEGSTTTTYLTDEAFTLLSRIAQYDPLGKKALDLYGAWVKKMGSLPPRGCVDI